METGFGRGAEGYYGGLRALIFLVIDKMKYTVTVTQEHWNRGKKDEGHCPVALAMIDAGVVNPRVDRMDRVWYFKEGLKPSNPIKLPKELKGVGVAFDNRSRKYVVPQFPITAVVDTAIPEIR